MKLLVVSDEADRGLWDHYSPAKLSGIDGILSCGDLPAEYLSFLVTVSGLPLFYIHGNHDGGYEKRPPEGCQCIDGKLITFQGYRILGLGGSMRYREGPHQYTEWEMRRRVCRLSVSIRRRGGFDILVTHAPAQGIGDLEDLCHRGFSVFRELLERYRPLYYCHGHVHLRYSPQIPRLRSHGGTTVVNASGRYVLELPDRIGGERPERNGFRKR